MPSYYDPAAVVNPYATGYGYPMAPWGYNIVGQEQPGTQPAGTQPAAGTTTQPTESFTDKTKAFMKKETFGVKNQNILIGAAVVAGLYLAYDAGMLGGKKHAAGDPRRRHRRHRDSDGDPRRHHRGRRY